MLFQWTKKLTIEREDFVLEDLIATSESFAAGLSLVTEEIEDITWPRGDTNFIFEC